MQKSTDFDTYFGHIEAILREWLGQPAYHRKLNFPIFWLVGANKREKVTPHAESYEASGADRRQPHEKAENGLTVVRATPYGSLAVLRAWYGSIQQVVSNVKEKTVIV